MEEVFDREQEVEDLCRWGAARAGAIVVLPLVGSLTLMANEFYMIKKIADLYGYELDKSAAGAFFGALGGVFAGQTLTTVLPFPPLQIPIAICTTYAIGKVANEWIKDGMPTIGEKYNEMFKKAKQEAEALVPMLTKNPLRDKPLGDENENLKFNSEKS